MIDKSTPNEREDVAFLRRMATGPTYHDVASEVSDKRRLYEIATRIETHFYDRSEELFVAPCATCKTPGLCKTTEKCT